MTQVKTTFRQVKNELYHKTLGLLINQKLITVLAMVYSQIENTVGWGYFVNGRFKGHPVTYKKVLRNLSVGDWLECVWEIYEI